MLKKAAPKIKPMPPTPAPRMSKPVQVIRHYCVQTNANKEEVKCRWLNRPSKAAFRKNIKAEVNAGKPVKQAVAIAYSVKRESAKKGKK
jgi:hypothetical protein